MHIQQLTELFTHLFHSSYVLEPERFAQVGTYLVAASYSSNYRMQTCRFTLLDNCLHKLFPNSFSPMFFLDIERYFGSIAIGTSVRPLAQRCPGDNKAILLCN